MSMTVISFTYDIQKKEGTTLKRTDLYDDGRRSWGDTSWNGSTK